MVDRPGQSDPAEKSPVKKSKFLTEAKAAFEQVFTEHLEAEGDFPTIESYTQALRVASWEKAEQLLKRSYYNGKRESGR